MEKEIVFDDKNSLTNKDIENFCKKNDININILTLEEINENLENANKFCIIFTGNESNKYNTLPEKIVNHEGKEVKYNKQALTHHWMAIFGNQIFDSYGYQKDYVLPDVLNSVDCNPSRIQEFNSVVCGQYSLCFLYYCKNEKDLSINTLGRDFCYQMGFTTDRLKNDEIVITWYENNK